MGVESRLRSAAPKLRNGKCVDQSIIIVFRTVFITLFIARARSI